MLNVILRSTKGSRRVPPRSQRSAVGVRASTWLFLAIFLSNVSFAAPGPGITQVTFSASEIGEEIFHFPNSVVGDMPTIAAFQHGYLYIGSGGGVQEEKFINWYDLSNPREPVLVEQMPTIGNKPHMSAFWEDKMLDGHHDHRVLRIWDFDDRTLRSESSGSVGTVWYMGQIPYVYRPRNGYATDAALMEIMDVSDPDAPFIATVMSLAALVNFHLGATHAVGNLLIGTASQAKGVVVFDISSPLKPVVLDTLVTGNDVYTSSVQGSRLYAGEIDRGVRVYDFSDPTSLTEVGFIDLPGSPRYIELKEGKGYVVPGTDRLHVFDAETLEVLDSHRLPGRSDFVLALGNIAVIGGGDETNRSSLVPIERNPDQRGPRITYGNPTDGETGVATTSRIGFIMNERIDITSLDPSTFTVRPVGGDPVVGTYSTQHGVINFSPDSPLEPETLYEVIFPAGGIRDAVGNSIESEHRISFTTGMDFGQGSDALSDLAAHWRFNNDTTDSSGNDRGGVLIDGGSFSADRVEGPVSLSLDGENDYVLSGAMDLGDLFSIALWVKIDQGASDIQGLVTNSGGGFETNGFRLFVNSFQTNSRSCYTFYFPSRPGRSLGPEWRESGADRYHPTPFRHDERLGQFGPRRAQLPPPGGCLARRSTRLGAVEKGQYCPRLESRWTSTHLPKYRPHNSLTG